jgi:hypothetical protein
MACEYLGLPGIVKWWMKVWQQGSPNDWQALLPDIDYALLDRPLTPHHLPVLSALPAMLEQAPEANRAFIQLLIDHAESLHFNQTYTEDDIGAGFLQQYGWIKFIGPDAYWDSDVLSGGLVLFGDDVNYPEHWMEAEGLYYIISGTGNWYREDIGWKVRRPGEWVVHASNVKHALKTDGEPLLLMYLLRGDKLTQKSDFE